MSELSTATAAPRTLLYGDLISAVGERGPGGQSLVRRATDEGRAASAFILWPDRAALLVGHAPAAGEPHLDERLLANEARAPLCELVIPAGAAPDGGELLIALENALTLDVPTPLRLDYERLSALASGAAARRLLGPLVRLSEATAWLGHLASTDPMTALPTQSYIQQRLQDALLTTEPFALLAVDGGVVANAAAHSYAERAALLRQLGALLVSTLGADDELGHGRLPEAFMILLPRASAEHARAHAEHILKSVRRHPWPLQVTLSIGIALYPDEGASADALIRAAESAALEARRRECDCVIFHRDLPLQREKRVAS